MKKLFILFLIIAMALTFFTACQAMTEKSVVIRKDLEQMLENAEKGDTDTSTAQNLSEQYGVPATYTYDKQSVDGKLKIRVDAQVSVPEASAMPIYRVKQTEFSQETVSALFNALCGEAEMWVYSGQQTKEQISDNIVRLKERIAKIKDDPKLSEDLAMTQNSLETWEQRFETAPDTLDEDRSYGEMEKITISQPKGHISNTAVEGGEDSPEETLCTETITYIGLEAYERYDQGINGMGRYIDVRNDGNPTMFFSNYHNPAGGDNFGSSPSLAVMDDADVDADIMSKIGIKPSEARQMVQELLDKTGSGMKVDSVYLQDDRQNGIYDGVARSAERYAYRIYCVRMAEGFPCSYVIGGSKLDPEDMMSPYWPYEEMYFMVNSEGIFQMFWHNPLEVIETVNDDAKLKSFGDIKEIFERMMSVKYEPQAGYGESEYDFEINRVTLSLHRIIEKDSNQIGLLVPVWNFYGKQAVKAADGSQFENLGETFLTINAIDGSVIDIGKGY